MCDYSPPEYGWFGEWFTSIYINVAIATVILPENFFCKNHMAVALQIQESQDGSD